MINYIIDGNNLIGKIKSLMDIQRKGDKQSSRGKLVLLLDRYFSNKKNSVTLHLDGFENDKINSSSSKIIYSQKLTADEKIKNQIEHSSSRKNIIVITSDNNIAEFARVCGCKVISSVEFASMIKNLKQEDAEENRIKQINNDEFIKAWTKQDD
jgi:predicted RNA-binding protein with PIN domain